MTGFFGDYLNRYFEQQIYVQLVWKNPKVLKGIRFESTVFDTESFFVILFDSEGHILWLVKNINPKRRRLWCNERNEIGEIDEVLEFRGKMRQGRKYELRIMALSERVIKEDTFDT